MGSFNVACSVSSLSIGCGDEVYFLPLLPNTYRENEPHYVGTGRMLLEPNCYFNPMTLPIKGKYNDYGALEKIVRDENTEQIEKFFGIDIESFVGCVGDNRYWTDYFGSIFESYVVNKEIIKNYDVEMNHNFLMELGFEKNENERYVFKTLPYEVEIFEDEEEGIEGMAYRIYDKEGALLAQGDSYDAKEGVLRDFQRVTGYFLNVSEENQKRVEILVKSSGMFIHASVFERLAEYNVKTRGSVFQSYVSVKSAEKLGFIREDEKPKKDPYHDILMRKSGIPFDLHIGEYGAAIYKGGKEKASVFSVAELKKEWERLTKDELNLDVFEGESVYDDYYDDFLEKIEKMKARSARCKETMLKTVEAFKKAGEEEEATRMLEEIEDTMSDDLFNPFSSFGTGGRFMDVFKEWKYFEPLYKDTILEGKLRTHFRNYRAFYNSMFSANRFLFPAMNGEQCGNHTVSKVLYEVSLEIASEKAKEETE